MLTNKKQPGGFALLITCLLAILCGCSKPGDRALLQGEKLLARGDYSKALEKLQRAVELKPNHPQAWNYLGLADQAAGNPANAVGHYLKAIDLYTAGGESDGNADPSVMFYNLGYAYYEQEQWEPAVEAFRKSTDLGTDFVAAWLQLGSACLHWGTLELSRIQNTKASNLLIESRAAFSRALDTDPLIPQALNGLGILLRIEKNYVEAAVLFRQALDQRLDYAPALLNLAVVSEKIQGRDEEAMQAYREYLDLELVPPPPRLDDVRVALQRLEKKNSVKKIPNLVPLETRPDDPVGANEKKADSTSSPEQAETEIQDPARVNPKILLAKAEIPRSDSPGFEPLPEISPSKPEIISGTGHSNDKPPSRSQENPPRENKTESYPGNPKEISISSELPGKEEALQIGFSENQTASSSDGASSVEGVLANISDQESSLSVTAADLPSPGIEESILPKEQESDNSIFIQPITFSMSGDQEIIPRSLDSTEDSEPPPAQIQSSKGFDENDYKTISRYSYYAPERPKRGNRAGALLAFEKGRASEKRGDLSDAMASYLQAVRQDGSLFQACSNLGATAYRIGKLNHALPAFEQALAIRADSHKTRYNFSLVLAKAGYYVDSALQLNRVVDSDVDHLKSHLALANLYAGALNRLDLAAAQYREVLRIQPGHPEKTEILFWLAQH